MSHLAMRETTRSGGFREGVVGMAPVMVAYVPFALVVGTAVAESADPLAAWLGTSTIYGGAAHLAVLDVLADGAGWWSAAVVGLLVNARLAAYAAAMAPVWRSAPLSHRAGAAVMLSDAPWALARGRTDERGFYLGAGLTLFVCWPVMVTLAIPFGASLSAVPVTSLLPGLALGVIVVPRLRVRRIALATGASVVTALVTAGQPAGPALLACAGAGVVAAIVGGARS